MKIDFSVIIVTNNRFLDFKKCLYSVFNSLDECACSKKSEVIIVNTGNHEDKIKKEINFYKSKIKTTYCFNSEKNISLSRSIGVEHASNRHIVFIDDDIILKKTFFEGLSDLWQKYPEAKMIGGNILAKSDEDVFFTDFEKKKIILKNNWCFAHQERVTDQKIELRDLLFSACFSYKIEEKEETVFNQNFGLVHKKFIFGGEDFDLCTRLLLKNKTILFSCDKRIQVFHHIDEKRFKKKYLIKRYFINGMELAKLENSNNLKLYKLSSNEYELFRLVGYLLYKLYEINNFFKKKFLEKMFKFLNKKIKLHIKDESYDSMVKKLIDLYKIDLIIDVGANVGLFSTLMRKIGFKKYILAVEPNKNLFGILDEKFLNDDNFFRVNGALIVKKMKGKGIYICKTNDNLSSFLKPSDKITNHKYVRTKVENYTFDDLLVIAKERFSLKNPRIFLKLDTQGLDYQILSEFKKNIMENVCLLQTECSFDPLYNEEPSFVESIRLIKDLKFNIVRFDSVLRDGNMNLMEADCLCSNSRMQK